MEVDRDVHVTCTCGFLETQHVPEKVYFSFLDEYPERCRQTDCIKGRGQTETSTAGGHASLTGATCAGSVLFCFSCLDKHL
jgi:hypothetical protein